MTDKTIKELVVLHNELATRTGDKHLEYWKGSKEKLYEVIDELEGKAHELDLAKQAEEDALEAAKPKAEKPATVKDPNRGKICTMIRGLLIDPAGHSYLTIVNLVIAAHPTAKTTTRSVASIAADLRRDGIEVAMRKPAKQAAEQVVKQLTDDGVTGE